MVGRREMTVARISRALRRMYGIVSCVLLASVNLARADLNVDRTTDNAAHQTLRNNSSDVARGGPLHLFGWSSDHGEEHRTEKRWEKPAGCNHAPSKVDRNEKRMRRQRIAVFVVALVIIATQVPDVYAQGDNAPALAASPATQAPSAPNSAASPDKAAPASSAEPTSVAIAELPQDLSPWGMFVHADRIVKAVMIGLAIASLMTWTVWIAKSLELRGARAAVRKAVRVLGKCATLAQANAQLGDGTDPAAQLLQAATNEIRFSANLRADGLKERVAWQLERIEMAAGRKISRGTGVLATIGSTAPFVGLFGTVWGIMDSFIGISRAHTTNLAVVAPGIAEALLATALGLVAAIPAVMIYNVLARSTAHYRASVGDISAQVMKLVSRDLDRAKLPQSHAAE